MTTSPWRTATDDEVRAYYASEFEKYISEMPWYLEPDVPKEYAVSFGDREYYPAKGEDGTNDRDFIRRYTEINGETVFPTWNTLIDFLASPAARDPLREYSSNGYLADPSLISDQDEYTVPVSRAVYHSVQTTSDQWMLVVDVDAKDIAKIDAQQRVQNGRELPDEVCLEKAGYLSAPPEGYEYTFDHIDDAIGIGFEIEEVLQDKFNHSCTQVVYSGQGVHIYGFDHDRFHRYDDAARKVLVKYLSETEGYPIDKCVTKDVNRVIRMPYSLHAEVSRIVTPLTSKQFDPRTDAIPAHIAEVADHV